MVLALTDAAVVIAIMTLIGLFGYLMDSLVDRDEHKGNHS
jgi:ABC-type nitrate/sulfonate/bicarbonate transport system permease component